MLGAFAKLHEPCGKGPEAKSRFDRPTAEEYLIFPLRDAARNDFWIVIVNPVTLVTHVARQIVTERNLQGDRGATMATEVHGNQHPESFS
jgi:hypothetical protein